MNKKTIGHSRQLIIFAAFIVPVIALTFAPIFSYLFEGEKIVPQFALHDRYAQPDSIVIIAANSFADIKKPIIIGVEGVRFPEILPLKNTEPTCWLLDLTQHEILGFEDKKGYLLEIGFWETGFADSLTVYIEL